MGKKESEKIYMNLEELRGRAGIKETYSGRGERSEKGNKSAESLADTRRIPMKSTNAAEEEATVPAAEEGQENTLEFVLVDPETNQNVYYDHNSEQYVMYDESSEQFVAVDLSFEEQEVPVEEADESDGGEPEVTATETFQENLQKQGTKVLSQEMVERLREEALENEAAQKQQKAQRAEMELAVIEEIISRGRQNRQEDHDDMFDAMPWGKNLKEMLRYLPSVNSSIDDPAQFKADLDEMMKGNYKITTMAARGAESVLYRVKQGGTVFCIKAIRNFLDKILGTSATRHYSSVLKEVSYRTKCRHIKNEFAIAKLLADVPAEDGDVPVRIYFLRRQIAFLLETGHDMVMEFINGYSFSDKSLVRSLNFEDKVRICYKMAKSLKYLHDRSIVHLDIKPSNFMLDVNGKVRIIDFGVSVMKGTRNKAITGTVGYLSPEQIAREEVDERTDIFALGVVFGVLFGGKSLTQELGECAKKTARLAALQDMTKNNTSAVVEMPELTAYPDLASIISNCSVWNRSQRVQSCQQLMLLIKQFAIMNHIKVED